LENCAFNVVFTLYLVAYIGLEMFNEYTQKNMVQLRQIGNDLFHGRLFFEIAC
jgi:hypothetical protein